MLLPSNCFLQKLNKEIHVPLVGLQKRVVEVELLDPVQCMTIAEGIDSVIW